jgi:hypothetical protein
MWSFQGPRAVYSPEESREQVLPDHRHSLSNQYTDSTFLPSSPLTDHHLPAEIESVTPVAGTPRFSRQEPWPESASGSTLTHDKEQLDVYDLEQEGKPPPVSGPVPFWSSALNATRMYIFVRYAWTCEQPLRSVKSSLTLQYSYFASLSSPSSQYTGEFSSASRKTCTVQPLLLSISMVR